MHSNYHTVHFSFANFDTLFIYIYIYIYIYILYIYIYVLLHGKIVQFIMALNKFLNILKN